MATDSTSTSTSSLPIIDLAPFLFSTDTTDAAALAQCQAAAAALITYGALLVHDPRVPPTANDSFLDLLEDYFSQPTPVLSRDERPEIGYQVGVTLENTEKPRCATHAPCLDTIRRLHPSERPLDISGHSPDPKCRFFWKVGEPREEGETEFPALNAKNVVPEIDELGIRSRWEGTMGLWGKTMRDAVDTLCEMLAVGLDLPRETFREAGARGSHLLAPTASDLARHGKKDTILAGFHTDLNFLTIHGRSRYPGLNIWARNTGRRIAVRIPPEGNYLLVQAGKQLEHVTGGLIRAGYHEVVVNEATLAAVERRKGEFPDRPLVRISSTFFWHLESDYTMRPIDKCVERLEEEKKDEARGVDLGQDEKSIVGTGYEGGEGYPAMKVGEFVQNELKHIALMV